jgi:polysaccharide pyruvyl transferase WcaK-like protein
VVNQKLKVAVLGWYGHNNFGDDVVLLEGLRQLFKGWDIKVFSDSPNTTYPMIDFKAVNSCDLFVLGGGELINKNRLFFGSNWAHHIKIPKVVLGVGVNAEKSAQISGRVVDDLKQFDYIGLRDNIAVDILRSIPELSSKVGLFYDLAFAIDVSIFKWNHSEDCAVVIPTDRHSNVADQGIIEFDVVENSRNWLTQRLETYNQALFVPFGQEDNNDFQTCQQLSSCARSSIVFYTASVSLPRLLALMLGAKYEFYPYHWKLQRVHDTITGLLPEEIKQKQRAIFNDKILL